MSKIQTQVLKTFAIFVCLILPLPAIGQNLQDTWIADNQPISSVVVAQATPSPIEAQNPSPKENSSAQGTSLISIIISMLSLGVSIAVAYFSNFRQASIKLSLGRNIIFFSVPQIAGLGFNVPITFYNWSPQGGAVYRLRLVISRQGSDDYYDMAWTTFVKIGSEGVFEDEDLAQPIPVEGRSSVNKIIRFDWSQEESRGQIDIGDGNYELIVYGWTSHSDKPDLEHYSSFAIKKEIHYERYRESVANNSSLSIWVSLDENEKPNQILSKNNIDRLYSNKK